MFFQWNCRSKNQGGLEHRNCMRQPMPQIQTRCRKTTQTYENIFKINNMRYHYYNFPCAKPWAGLARNLRDAGFKLPQSSPQTRKLNLHRGVLERSPYTFSPHRILGCNHNQRLTPFYNIKAYYCKCKHRERMLDFPMINKPFANQWLACNIPFLGQSPVFFRLYNHPCTVHT